MELVIFIGIQAVGKSTFYRETFFRTHLRMNLDMLRKRHREQVLFEACLASKTRVVVDNTNITPKVRARYIGPAKEAGFTVIGYYFRSKVDDALHYNRERPADQQVPDVAIKSFSRNLVRPSYAEGFDELYYVRALGNDRFAVEAWIS